MRTTPKPVIVLEFISDHRAIKPNQDLHFEEFLDRLRRFATLKPTRFSSAQRSIISLSLAGFPDCTVTPEKLVKSENIRDRWLTQLFTLTELARLKDTKQLAAFHARHSLILSLYNKRVERKLERLVESGTTSMDEYARKFHQAFQSSPRMKSVEQVFRLAYDHYRTFLDRSEQSQFRSLIARYLDSRASLNDLRKHVQILSVRYDKSFVRENSVFRPYPPALM